MLGFAKVARQDLPDARELRVRDARLFQILEVVQDHLFPEQVGSRPNRLADVRAVDRLRLGNSAEEQQGVRPIELQLQVPGIELRRGSHRRQRAGEIARPQLIV